jgi:hypothetical protein
MKKTTGKLVVRSETLRVLRALDNVELARARGGGDTIAAADSTNTQSGFNCPAHAAVIVTK